MFACVKFQGETEFRIVKTESIRNFSLPVDTSKNYNVNDEGVWRQAAIAFVEGFEAEIKERIARSRPRVRPQAFLRSASDLTVSTQNVETKKKPTIINVQKILNLKLSALKERSEANSGNQQLAVMETDEERQEKNSGEKSGEDINASEKRDDAKESGNEEKVAEGEKDQTDHANEEEKENTMVETKKQLKFKKKKKKTPSSKEQNSEIKKRTPKKRSVVLQPSTLVKRFKSDLESLAMSASHIDETTDTCARDNACSGDVTIEINNAPSYPIEVTGINEKSSEPYVITAGCSKETEKDEVPLVDKKRERMSKKTPKDMKKKKEKLKTTKRDHKIVKSKSKTSGSNAGCHCGHGETVTELKNEVSNLSSTLKEMMETQTAIKIMITAVYNNWEQLKSAQAENTTEKGQNFDDIGRPPAPGFIRKEGTLDVIHCGENVWIPKVTFDNAVKNAKTHAVFVKNIAVAVFGFDTLKNSSVTGIGCPRTGSNPKPALDATKCLAVRSIFDFYLRKIMKYTDAEIEVELGEYLNYIRGKISDMNRPPKTKVNDKKKVAPARDAKSTSSGPENKKEGNDEERDVTKEGHKSEEEKNGSDDDESESAGENETEDESDDEEEKKDTSTYSSETDGQ